MLWLNYIKIELNEVRRIYLTSIYKFDFLLNINLFIKAANTSELFFPKKFCLLLPRYLFSSVAPIVQWYWDAGIYLKDLKILVMYSLRE